MLELSKAKTKNFFFDQNPAPMVVFDLQTLQILKVNEAAEEKYCYSVEEFEGMNIKDIHARDEVPIFLEHLGGIDKEQQSPYHLHKKKNGDVFYAQVSSRNFSWQETAAQLAVIHDVSVEVEMQQRAKKLEKEAREERKFSQLLIKSLPDAFWLMDKDGKVADWNQHLEEVSGFSGEEISNRYVMDFFAEEERARLEKALAAAFTEGKATAEGTLITKNGNKIPHALTGIKFTYHDEPYIAGIGVNISEQKDRQKKLEEKEQQLRRAQNIAQLGSWEMAFEDMQLHWSDQVYELFGLSKDDFNLTFENFLERVPVEERSKLKQDLQNAMAGELDREIEHRIITSEGDVRHVVEMGEVDYDAEGNPVKVSGIIQDITLRKNSKIELQKSRENLKRAHEIAQVGSFEWNVVKDELAYSQEAYNIYGIEKNDHNKPKIEQFLNIIHPDDREFVNSRIEQILKGDGFEEFEHRLLIQDGVEKQVIQRCDVDYDEDGSVVKVFGTVQDITRQKEIQNELSIRSKAIEASMDGVAIVNTDNQYIYMNEAHASIFGYESAAELTGEKWSKLYDKEHINILKKEIFTELEVSGKWRGETVAQRKDGSLFPQELSVSKIQGGGFVCICRDISKRKSVEQKIKENEERWKRLVEENPKAVQVTIDGEILFINEAGIALYDAQSRDEVIGMSVYDFTHPDDLEEVMQRRNKLESGLPVEQINENRIITFAGNERYVEVHSVPITYRGKDAIQTNIYDVTDRKERDQIIEASLKEKEVLLAEVHHRVKNNLAIISGLLELEAINWEGDTAIKKVMDESRLRIHSMAMIHEKLYQTANFTDLRLENYIAELVETISETMKMNGKNISINIDSDDIELNINYAIPCALIINELVTNAFKHAFNGVEKGKLDIKLKKNEEKISLMVRDNGPGMPEDFDNESTKSLGYVLVRQLTKQLHGKLKMRNDNGAYFEITFRKGKKSGPSSSVRFANRHQK
jgi:PAS domain S-box-containing protein